MSIIEQHYRVLGLNSRQCDLNDVKKAYKSKALQLHPDRNPNKSDDAFKRVHAAYEAIVAYHHRNPRHSRQSNLGKSSYNNSTSNAHNYFTHNTNNNNNKQSSNFTNNTKSSEYTTSSSIPAPLFTEEELFGSHTIPGGWVFRDGATHKPTLNKNNTNSNDHAARREATNTNTTTTSTPNLPELSSSQSSMKTAYEAAEQHWRQAHGPRVPVSGYKSPFHIPSDFAETSRNREDGNGLNATSNGESYTNNKGAHKDVEDVKAKYKQYREEQQQNLHLLAQQHAQLHNGKMTAFEFSKYSTAEEKKAALHERWNSLEKNINSKISVADDLVNGKNHDSNRYTTNGNETNSINANKHYSSSISPNEAALLMAEVAAMSKKKKKMLNKNSNVKKEEEEQEKNEEKELQQEKQVYLKNESINTDDEQKSELEEKSHTDNCSTNISQCHETSTHKAATTEVKENKEIQGKEESEVDEHKRTSEAHRDELAHERRELMYQLFYQQYAPDPALVSQMSDAELYSLLQFFQDVSGKLEKVFNARLTSSHCSRCGQYGTVQQPTQETININNVNSIIMTNKEGNATVQESNKSFHNDNQQESRENCNVNEQDEKLTSIKSKVNAFNCAHVCVCEECAKWATECPLCGASIKHNV